jgi:hypothetical protein
MQKIKNLGTSEPCINRKFIIYFKVSFGKSKLLEKL